MPHVQLGPADVAYVMPLGNRLEPRTNVVLLPLGQALVHLVTGTMAQEFLVGLDRVREHHRGIESEDGISAEVHIEGRA